MFSRLDHPSPTSTMYTSAGSSVESEVPVGGGGGGSAAAAAVAAVVLPDFTCFDLQQSKRRKRHSASEAPPHTGEHTIEEDENGPPSTHTTTGCLLQPSPTTTYHLPPSLSSSHGRLITPATPTKKSPSHSRLTHQQHLQPPWSHQQQQTPQPHPLPVPATASRSLTSSYRSSSGSHLSSAASSLASSWGRNAVFQNFISPILNSSSSTINSSAYSHPQHYHPSSADDSGVSSHDSSINFGSPGPAATAAMVDEYEQISLMSPSPAAVPSPLRSARKRSATSYLSSSSASTPHPPSLASSRGRRGASISRFDKEFHSLGEIGKGNFGECYHVCDHIGEQFAIKKIMKTFKGEKKRADLMREVNHLKRVRDTAAIPTTTPPQPISTTDDHRHLVRFISDWEEDGVLFIQTELLEGGTVHQYLNDQYSLLDQSTKDTLTLILFLDVARGLRFLHDRTQLAHLDLKWENIFIANSFSGIDAGLIKIGDFGTSINMAERAAAKAVAAKTRISTSFSTTSTASSLFSTASIDGFNSDPLQLEPTPYEPPAIEEGDKIYLAPELLGDQSDISLAAADIFSFGLMMLEVVCDIELPKGDGEYQTLRSRPSSEFTQLMDQYFNLNPPSELKYQLRPLLERMLSRNPHDRPTAAQILTNDTLIQFVQTGSEQRARTFLKDLKSALRTSASSISAKLSAGHLTEPLMAQFDLNSSAATPMTYSPGLNNSNSLMDDMEMTYEEEEQEHTSSLPPRNLFADFEAVEDN